MNNSVRNRSNDHRVSSRRRFFNAISTFLAISAGSLANLHAQTVTTLVASNLFEPHGVATDGVNAYITDASNNRIVKLALTTSNLTTLAGLTGPAGVGYAEGTGSSALFNQPLGIAFARGGLVVVDSGNQVIRLVSTNGTTSLLAGVPGANNGLGGSANGIGAAAQFAFPTAIVADGAGNLYVADTGNNAIRKIDNTAANNVTTITTSFNAPEALALDTAGNLWVADTGNNAISVINNIATANVVTPIANLSHINGAKDGLNAAASTFNYPAGLFWSTNMSSLLISDTGNDTIRNLFQTNGIWSVQTIAGTAGVAGQQDGSLSQATFDAPVGITLDLHDGNNFYYVVDRSTASNGTLRALQPSVLARLIPGPPSVTLTAPADGTIAIMPPSVTISLTDSDTNLNGTVTNVTILTNNAIFSSNSTATTYTLTNPAVGSYVIVAVATDNYGLSATSAPVNVKIIAPLSPQIGIVIPTNGSFYTRPASITIVTTNLDPNTAYVPSAGIATVTLYANGTNIPVTALPSNTFVWNNPAVGQYSLTAVATESPFGLSATSAPVNISVVGVQQPIVTITNPAPGSIYFAPTNIPISVSAIDPNTNGINAIGQITGVTLLNNGTNLLPSQYTYLGQTVPGVDVYTFILNDPSVGNYSLSAVATDSVFSVSGTSAPVNISVTLPPPPAPSFSPNFGYFPFCQTINLTETAPNQPIQLFYTVNGTTPTTNSLPVINLVSNAGGIYTGSIQWCDPLHDLSHLQVFAFNGVVSSPVTIGQSAPTNEIGFVKGVTNGAGSTVILPIVVDLKSNGVLASLQFRAEVIPTGGSAPITNLTLLPLSTNDFVPLIGPGTANSTVTFETVSYSATNNGAGLLISAAGGNSGFQINNFGVVGLLAAQIPGNAAVGSTYKLQVVAPFGTSDAQQGEVSLQSLSSQTLTVEPVDYLVGDSSPGSGYNAGEFGDGTLNAADVNNALYASVGIRVPYPFSDAYNAMDVYPETTTELGDGFITYLDWQHILYRSEGLETTDWVRYWANGARAHFTTNLPPVPGPLAGKSSSTAGAHPKDVTLAPGYVWFREASITAGTQPNVQSGNTCSLPVYANVNPGYSLAGLQFRATLVANGDAPLPGNIEFTPASNIPATTQLPGLAPYDIVCAWNIGAFTHPLQGSNYLGTITFQVPHGAQRGDSYSLRFSGVGGGADLYTDYQMESFPGAAWVMSAPLTPRQITSDEWRTTFFGSYTNTLADDNADPDHDGALNWQEFVAGTHPNNPNSRLQFTGINLIKDQSGAQAPALNWLTAPGKTYLLEAAPGLSGGNWTVIGTHVGDGNAFQFTPPIGGSTSFYRLIVQP